MTKYKALSLLLVAASLTACSTQVTQSTAPVAASTGTSTSANASSGTAAPASATPVAVDYEADDASGQWQDQAATRITLNGDSITLDGPGAAVDGSTLYLVSSGVFVLTGNLPHGQVIIDSQTKGTVRLVLDGATIQNDDGPAIWAKKADKTIITLNEGTENQVIDGQTYADTTAEDAPNAAIFSMDDLTINGAGRLTVRGNFNNGIMSKDDLRITGGTLMVYAADDALVGRDRVMVKDGAIAVESGGDGVKTTNEDDPEKGHVAIEGGNLTVTAGADGIQAHMAVQVSGGSIRIDSVDDAIHADESLLIAGGSVTISESYEGLEAKVITVTGGQTSLIASDDGVNLSEPGTGSAQTARPGQGGGAGGKPGVTGSGSGVFYMQGGTVSVDAAGDGIDSNGSVYMSGGTLLVNGPTANMNGALDYDGVFELTGGTVIAAGSSGMVQTPSEQSTVNSVGMLFTQVPQAGTTVSIRDSQGKELLSLELKRSYPAVIFASPELKQGESYAVYAGEQKVVGLEIGGSVTWVNESGVTTAPRGGGFRGRP